MSLLGKIVGFGEEVIGDAKSAISTVKKALKAAWDFLTHTGGILSGAWDWMVNGVSWFTSQVSDWAASVYTFGKHLLTEVLPHLATWVFKQAVKWAGRRIHDAETFLRGLVKNVVAWALRELHSLTSTVKSWVSALLRFVTGPIRWVLTTGKHVAALVLNPKALAEWVVGALIVPLILWVLKSSANVIAWFAKSLVARDSEIAHIVEEVLAKVI